MTISQHFGISDISSSFVVCFAFILVSLIVWLCILYIVVALIVIENLNCSVSCFT